MRRIGVLMPPRERSGRTAPRGLQEALRSSIHSREWEGCMAVSRDQHLRRAAVAATLAFGLLSSQAHSQEWPARPVTMVVPTAAGGGADIVGRILAARLAELLGQPVIIENVGNAVAANNRVAKGMPDGYQFV